MIHTPHAQRPSRTARQRRNSFRPQIDILEQRAMLAADLGFTPLSASANTIGGTGGDVPFDLAEGFSQTVVQRGGNAAADDADLGVNLGQNTLNESGPFVGRFLFSTALETTVDEFGDVVGTLNRTDLTTGETINLLDIAVADGQPEDETFGSHLTLQNLRAIRWTPWGTLLVAETIEAGEEDASGNPFVPDADADFATGGLVYEIFDPTGSQPIVVARPALGSGNIEGIDIGSDLSVYYTDNDSGVFRFTSDFEDSGSETASPLESGTVDVLQIIGSGFGEAVWVPADVLADPELSTAAAAAGGTFFNGARDLEIGFADFGQDEEGDLENDTELDETLYVAIQGDDKVIAVDLDGRFGDDTDPYVYNFVDASVDGDFNDPVDIAVDSSGRVYIGEAIDPNPGVNDDGNDVWVANDVADDIDDETEFGFAVIDPVNSTDELGRLASLRVANAAVAGLYVNPFNNRQIYVNSSSPIANRNAIVRFDNNDPSLPPGVSMVDNGDGDTVLTIVGTNNSDRIIITGNNLLNVRINNQVFRGLSSSQTVIVYGLGGNDYIIASSHTFYDYVVFGGSGSDYITTGQGDDSISGEAGNDRINASNGDNFVSGGDGNDSLVAGRDNDTLSGDAGNDRTISNAGDDTLIGGDGNDFLGAGLGNDFLTGNAGNDKLDGYYGDDILLGGPGADWLKGGSGQDVLVGGDGVDRLYGGDGEDVLIGDSTAIDDFDPNQSRPEEFWAEFSFDPDRAFLVYQFLDQADGVEDGDGITDDNERDLLDGERGQDLFFNFDDNDFIRRIGDGDEVADSNG